MTDTTNLHNIRIIIPIHKSTGILSQCLQAVEQSTAQLANTEVVVVNNSRSLDLQQELRGRRTVVVEAPKISSAAYARNKGAEGFTTGILIFIDHDVICEKCCIAQLIEPIRRGYCEGVIGNYSQNVTGLTFWQKYKQLYINHVYNRMHGLARNDFWTAIAAIRADVFIELGGFNTAFKGANGEDQEFGIRLTQQGYRVLTAPHAKGQHLNPYTGAGIIRNDFRKGVQAVRNSLANRVPLSDNRHASGRDKLAVLTSVATVALCFGTLFYPWLWLVVLCFGLAWGGSRYELLHLYTASQGWSFGLRTVGLMFLLDLVRMACMLTGFWQHYIFRS